MQSHHQALPVQTRVHAESVRWTWQHLCRQNPAPGWCGKCTGWCGSTRVSWCFMYSINKFHPKPKPQPYQSPAGRHPLPPLLAQMLQPLRLQLRLLEYVAPWNKGHDGTCRYLIAGVVYCLTFDTFDLPATLNFEFETGKKATELLSITASKANGKRTSPRRAMVLFMSSSIANGARLRCWGCNDARNTGFLRLKAMS